ncbi:ribonuclease P protein subunit p20 isoform X1 [Alosa sapidissima]|uniref:ribonuclease P protein subunit p20 isoform X1 n=1 Tax=Alosa sapidissima TaxID=34773 RepID=UPI001C08318F|nr:ribonuclease P protein subunit p20 isoform X1 [Alosa sapidissima]
MESIANVSMESIANVSMASITNVYMPSIANVSMESIANVSMASFASVSMASITNVSMASIESITNMSSCEAIGRNASAWSHEEKLAIVSLVVSLCTGFCMGIPTLVWALLYLRAHRDSGVTISPFMIALLLSDVLELALIPLMVYSLFQDETRGWASRPCVAMYPVFASIRLCGFVYHQLVVLQGAWALRRALSFATRPSFSFRPFAYNCVSFSMAAWLCVSYTAVNGYHGATKLIVCAVICFLVAFTATDTFKSFPSTNAVHCRLTGRRNPRLNIFLAYMAILFFVYGPFIVARSFNQYINPCVESLLFFMSLSIMSLRVVAEPLLCVLVCREFNRTWQTLDTNLRSY